MDWRMQVAQNAARRRAAVVRREMSRGLAGLATVAATAPFFGIAGNLMGIYGAFHGVDGEKTAIMADIAGHLSMSLAPAAYGVAVAVVALAGFRYLTARVAEMQAEMEVAVLAFPSWLAAANGVGRD